MRVGLRRAVRGGDAQEVRRVEEVLRRVAGEALEGELRAGAAAAVAGEAQLRDVLAEVAARALRDADAGDVVERVRQIEVEGAAAGLALRLEWPRARVAGRVADVAGFQQRVRPVVHLEARRNALAVLEEESRRAGLAVRGPESVARQAFPARIKEI